MVEILRCNVSLEAQNLHFIVFFAPYNSSTQAPQMKRFHLKQKIMLVYLHHDLVSLFVRLKNKPPSSVDAVKALLKNYTRKWAIA